MNYKKLILIGGEEVEVAGAVDEWFSYKNALILSLNLKTLQVSKVLEYYTPKEFMQEGNNIVFKSSHYQDGKFYVCTQTEVLIYSYPDFKVLKHFSHPYFNDLHHVRPNLNGNLLVVSTGLDTVFEMNMDGEIVEEWNAVGKNTWDRFDKKTDYRFVPTTKPHESHPNFITVLDDGTLWLTRFEQKDALCLTDRRRRIPIDLERPHDGHFYKGKLYYTTVNGWVVIADATTGEVLETINLNKINNPLHLLLGWCRSLAVVDDEHVIVGFSRVRQTKFKANINWALAARRNVGRLIRKPTRVALYNLKTKEELWSVSLDEHGMNGVFSAILMED